MYESCLIGRCTSMLLRRSANSAPSPCLSASSRSSSSSSSSRTPIVPPDSHNVLDKLPLLLLAADPNLPFPFFAADTAADDEEVMPSAFLSAARGCAAFSHTLGRLGRRVEEPFPSDEVSERRRAMCVEPSRDETGVIAAPREIWEVEGFGEPCVDEPREAIE